jgi:formiminotetrahydrofolate cyclodeaminase
MKDCKDFEEMLSAISSKSPAPGGGSVSALAGAMGASLVSMVSNLTIGRNKYSDVEDEMKQILVEADTMKKELMVLYQNDIEAFNKVMTAFRMPAGEREAALQEAYIESTKVPLSTAEKCFRVLQLTQTTIQKGNQNTITDSAVAALMAHSGLKGALFNVKINLVSIENEDFKAENLHKILALEKETQIVLNSVMSIAEAAVEADKGSN